MRKVRSLINNSDLGKRVNNSQIGKWFEQTDFAVAVEDASIDISKDYPKDREIYGNICALEKNFLRVLIAPAFVLRSYFAYKLTKHFNRPDYDVGREDIKKMSSIRAYSC